jgi:hypothetical protein
MSNAFRSHLSDLTASLVDAILLAARSATLDELIAEPHRGAVELHRNAGQPPPQWAGESTGQPPRRPADEVAKTLELVFLFLRGQKDGLRSEQLQRRLGVSKQLMSRVLDLGLASTKLTRKGQRRATTYSAATAGASARAASERVPGGGQQAFRF